MSATPDPRAADGELVITREFDAPRERVFEAWTDCDHFARWWGPNQFTTPHCSIDLRPGGRMHYDMRSPEGQDFWGIGVYREIVAPERLVYTDSFADERGEPVPAARYGMGESWPDETQVSVTFNEREGRTLMTLLCTGAIPSAERDMAETGWNESFDRLGAYLTAGAAAPRPAPTSP